MIKRIYELAWEQFSDLPRGRHKNNSMHKLASKTMMEILPEKLISHIERKLGSIAVTPDFFDVIGQVSWYSESGDLMPDVPMEEVKKEEEEAPPKEAEAPKEAEGEAATPSAEGEGEAPPAEAN